VVILGFVIVMVFKKIFRGNQPSVVTMETLLWLWTAASCGSAVFWK